MHRFNSWSLWEMRTSVKLATAYAGFALLATTANLAAQETSIRLYSGAFSIWVSVILGTGVGLLLKYVLDKRYIFRQRRQGLAQDSCQFARYVFMGLVTTAVFWGFEFGFDQLFQTRPMRYLGGSIGLAAGYWLKYQLDKRYVFSLEGT